MNKIDELIDIMKTLRADKGCPWDKAQTLLSLKQSFVEETVETICGINLFEKTGEVDNLIEELGDILMLLILECVIAEETELFTFNDVVQGVIDKMIRRHPNVFAEEENLSLTNQELLWNNIKKEEKNNKSRYVDIMINSAFTESIGYIEATKKRKSIC